MRPPFVRAVLGDVDPITLGACDAHEHAWIGECHATQQFPELRLDDADRIVTELKMLKASGVEWLIDCMPGGAGRDVQRLAELSLRSGLTIVASTGLHLAKYYEGSDAGECGDQCDMAAWFVDEITRGADRSTIRCGIVKIAGGRNRLTAREHNMFLAAAHAQHATGVPIITHTEEGTAAMEQVDLLVGAGGCDASRVTLSHLDRISDPDYHRALLERGINLEYDGHFRWKGRTPNPTVELIATLLPEFPEQIVVGMDAARSSYWTSYGGSPGLSYFVVTLRQQLQARGVSQELLNRLYIENPRRAFSFTECGGE